MQEEGQAQEEILGTLCERLNQFIQDRSHKLEDYDLADVLVKPFDFGTAPSGRWLSETADPPPHVKDVSVRAQAWAGQVKKWETSLNKTASYSSCLAVLTDLDDAKTDAEIQSCTRKIHETIAFLTGVSEGFEEDSKNISKPETWSLGQPASWSKNDSLRKKTIHTWVDKNKRWFLVLVRPSCTSTMPSWRWRRSGRAPWRSGTQLRPHLPPQPESEYARKCSSCLGVRTSGV